MVVALLVVVVTVVEMVVVVRELVLEINYIKYYKCISFTCCYLLMLNHSFTSMDMEDKAGLVACSSS
jgi:hypothetical protein